MKYPKGPEGLYYHALHGREVMRGIILKLWSCTIQKMASCLINTSEDRGILKSTIDVKFLQILASVRFLAGPLVMWHLRSSFITKIKYDWTAKKHTKFIRVFTYSSFQSSQKFSNFISFFVCKYKSFHRRKLNQVNIKNLPRKAGLVEKFSIDSH